MKSHASVTQPPKIVPKKCYVFIAITEATKLNLIFQMIFNLQKQKQYIKINYYIKLY